MLNLRHMPLVWISQVLCLLSGMVLEVYVRVCVFPGVALVGKCEATLPLLAVASTRPCFIVVSLAVFTYGYWTVLEESGRSSVQRCSHVAQQRRASASVPFWLLELFGDEAIAWIEHAEGRTHDTMLTCWQWIHLHCWNTVRFLTWSMVRSLKKTHRNSHKNSDASIHVHEKKILLKLMT